MNGKLPRGERPFVSPPICGSLRAAARHRAAGFTLVSAIFLMVVLVILGGSIVTLSSVQHSTAAMRIQSVRAHYAARAGLEWAIRRIGVPAACNGNFTVGGIDVAVTCVGTTHALNADTPTYFLVTATATSGVWGGTDFVSRRLQAKVMGP